MCCMTAIWPAGPPKVCREMANQVRVASRSGSTSPRRPGAVSGVAPVSSPIRAACSLTRDILHHDSALRAPAGGARSGVQNRPAGGGSADRALVDPQEGPTGAERAAGDPDPDPVLTGLQEEPALAVARVGP